MAEIQHVSSFSEGATLGGKPAVNGDSSSRSASAAGKGPSLAEDTAEGEKERTIAKAALSIAELGKSGTVFSAYSSH